MADGTGSVAVIGSGGIGGYLAGALEGAGRAVTLCVRTPFERLVVVDAAGEREVPVRIVASPDAVAAADWVLVTTKAQDTGSAAPWFRTLVGPGTRVVVVQNGVGQAERARPHLPAGVPVMPAIIYCSVERTAPGRIVHHGSTRMSVPAGEDGSAFARLFSGTPFAITQESDFVTVAWRKLLSNAVANPITALTLRRLPVFADPAVQALARGVMAEVIRVANAEGARLTEADGERVLDGYLRMGGDGGSSMLYDRLAGRPLEHDHITGAVVAAAERHGIDVPLNRAILALAGAVSGRGFDAKD
ncbi:2-dehydropantoate 2-reductase [Methylobacterium nonmethylotrophicum]|uniref:2-dehydropantoate 2-reductase n=1 Tax=Methylobacterium nonmethylotrophicum TaxID=1141884 RepID=A0A4Z0NK63_9HYPH|nr:2-dehydropantoate 2-reductase [Methylobacterium nonmethylotrophicum]TGD96772.1 2-dehydropantoate 2-reductase [Methylobacterium nonmethylotrophicum]